MMPDSPPMTKMKKKPRTKNSGVRNTGRPLHSVAIQQKICTPFGIAISMLDRGEEARAELRQPGREHVVHPQPEGQEPDGDQRQHQRQVAEDRAAREGRRRSPTPCRSPAGR